MKVVTPRVEVITHIADQYSVIRFLEAAGRTAYKSEAYITPESAYKFCKMLIARGHESVLEHFNITVKFVCDRGVSHELVRHRIASYTQESTRYCNYQGGIVVVEPLDFDGRAREVWLRACQEAERNYQELIALGKPPEQARRVLPIGVKTEVVATMNVREWRHVLRLRTAPAAHPDMQVLMRMLLRSLTTYLPALFEDIEE